jgi:hypothetical protein
MNNHLGICETCGFTTNTSRNHTKSCPNGHGTLTVVHQKYAKLINKKGSTGEDRLRRWRLLKKQWRQAEEEQYIGWRKRIGTGKPFRIWPIYFRHVKIK